MRIAVGLCVGVLTLLASAYVLRAVSKSTTFQVAGELVSRVETSAPVIALTFDDGPSRRHTQTLLDALAEVDATATFFLVGKEVEANPEAARAIIEAGHEIGNHSWAHDRFIFKSRDWIRDDLARTDAAIRAADYDGPLHMRPPYGMRLIALPRELSRQGRTTVMWSLALEGRVDDLAAAVVEEARPGDIVLLHGMYAGNAATRDALPEMLAGLVARGFSFVTISELMALQGT